MVENSLPFFPSPQALVSALSQTPNSFLLDSSDPVHALSGYSYAGFDPTQICKSVAVFFSQVNPLYPEASGFNAGWVGYIDYNGKDAWMGYYPCILVLDWKQQKCFLRSEIFDQEQLEGWKERWQELLMTPSRHKPTEEKAVLVESPFLEIYRKKFNRAYEYLKAGDVYQLNLTERFGIKTQKGSAEIYERLRSKSPAPFAAYLNTGELEIFSASPECLFKIKEGQIETHPIKGTRPKGADAQANQQIQRNLSLGVKENAELLMIVDLERNDLGRVCEFGSVKVDTPFSVELYSNVNHLVAKVTGKLRPGQTAFDIFKAIFPGGSVTGAPKKRAMEILEELESVPRGVYTGTIGYWGKSEAVFNIPIRTLYRKGSQVFTHAGGGIVIDSTAESEFAELQTKVAPLLWAAGLEIL